MMADYTEDLFNQLNPNRRKQPALYRNLSKEKLCAAQKKYLCEQLDKLEHGSAKHFIKRYNLNVITVYGWLRLYRKTGTILNARRGKPKIPDDQGLRDAMHRISEGVGNGGIVTFAPSHLPIDSSTSMRLFNDQEIEACFEFHAMQSRKRSNNSINLLQPELYPKIHAGVMKKLKKVIYIYIYYQCVFKYYKYIKRKL